VFLELAIAFLATVPGAAAYGFLFLLLSGAGIGAPLSQDMLLLASASPPLSHLLQWLPAAVVAWSAIVAGDALSFFTGRHYGARWLRRPWAARLVAPERLPGAEAALRRVGAVACFVTRFLPGQRATLFFAFGSLRLPWRPFLVGNGLAALVQVPLFLWGAHALGWQWQQLRAPFDRADDVLTAVVLLVLLVLWLRGRRPARA
jgi:membrane protein DedA with SNARE-associated domain